MQQHLFNDNLVATDNINCTNKWTSFRSGRFLEMRNTIFLKTNKGSQEICLWCLTLGNFCHLTHSWGLWSHISDTRSMQEIDYFDSVVWIFALLQTVAYIAVRAVQNSLVVLGQTSMCWLTVVCWSNVITIQIVRNFIISWKLWK